MSKEWQYILKNDEIYFTSEFRFPLDRIKQVTLDKGSGGVLWIIGGILVFLISLTGGESLSISAKVTALLLGSGLLVWGILKSRTYKVGFVILKDPKWQEKVYTPIYQSYSKEKAEKRLESLREELAAQGLNRVRIVKSL